MKIFIKEEKAAKIQKEIDAVAGKLRHTTDFEGVVNAVREVEQKLTEFKLPKKDWTGAVYIFGTNSKKANSYYYSYEALRIAIERFSSGWAIVGIQRFRAFPRDRTLQRFLITHDQLEIIQANVAKEFVVINSD